MGTQKFQDFIKDKVFTTFHNQRQREDDEHFADLNYKYLECKIHSSVWGSPNNIHYTHSELKRVDGMQKSDCLSQKNVFESAN